MPRSAFPCRDDSVLLRKGPPTASPVGARAPLPSAMLKENFERVDPAALSLASVALSLFLKSPPASPRLTGSPPGATRRLSMSISGAMPSSGRKCHKALSRLPSSSSRATRLAAIRRQNCSTPVTVFAKTASVSASPAAFFAKAQFTNCMHGRAMAVARQARGEAFSSSSRWNHRR